MSRHETYARAAGAELAVVAGLSNAAQRLADAAPAAEQNDWAGACLDRAAWRLHGGAELLSSAVQKWTQLGARFEIEYTRQLTR